MVAKSRLGKRQLKAQQSMQEQLDKIEQNQTLIMQKLGISVPEDEAEAEEPEASPEEDDAISLDYDAMKVVDLVEEAMKRGIYDEIEGTGSDGNVIKPDLVAALVADDESAE